MKRAVTAVLPVLLLAGCLGTAPKAPVNWTIEPKAASVFSAAAAKWGTVRLASVSVRAPYDGQRLAVLRADGSIAFDAFNTFAAAPAALMRGAARDVVEGSGLFARVVQATSSAAAPHALEIGVTRLALDCRTEGARRAVCELTVLLLNGREVVGAARGSGDMPAGTGNYSEAFSAAFTAALSEALGRL